MDGAQITSTFQLWANEVFVWVGFGTVVGLLAKAVMPGRDPGGAVATLVMGIGGAIIGCGVLAFFWEGQRISPISPIGMVVATAGAFLILIFYRILGGYWFVEGDGGPPRPQYRRRSRRRNYANYDE
ncbi:MAG: GlsB/YeaQ/YmgE family stress response membrane protein [Planctomycetales bacterium]|nr:GlsB/YeaQ/YmgE family stress response membrane protein [Planctomycetales bacterium]